MKSPYLKYFGFVISAAVAVSFIACGDKKDNNQAPQTSEMATTPQPCNNTYAQYFPGIPGVPTNYSYGYNGGYSSSYYYGNNYNGYYGNGYNPYQAQPNTNSACPNNMYQNAAPSQWYYGNWYWPNAWQPTATNNCGCPVGYFPVYGQTFGVACAPSTYGNAWGVVYFNYNIGWGSAQNAYNLNIPQTQYTAPAIGSCVSSTAVGCDTRLNNCSAGTVCQPVAGGSTIGLCVGH